MAYFALEQLNKMYDGYKRAFNLNGKSLLLIQSEGEVFIIENRCPHMDVSLQSGELLCGKKIRCLAHGIEFELANGQACGPLADTLDRLVKFDLVYDGDKVGVEI